METAPDGSLLVAINTADALANARLFESSKDGANFVDITKDLHVPKISRIVWSEGAIFLATPNGVYLLSGQRTAWHLDRRGMGILQSFPYAVTGMGG